MTATAEELIERLSRFETKHPRPSALLPPERVQAVKSRAIENIKELCYEFCPKGRPAPNGGYWEVPHPDLIKISLSTGKFFNLENKKRAKPLGDIIKLWTFLTGEENFRRIVVEMERWCKKVEGRRTEWQRNDGFDDWEIKEGVFVYLLNKGEKPVIRGTGRGLCLLLQKAYQDTGGLVKEMPIEFQKPTSFLRTLKKWAITGDWEFFTVTMKSRSRATEFILTVSTPRRRFS